MMLGFELWTSRTLQGCSDHYAVSVDTLVWSFSLRRYKYRIIFTWSHLVAGVERRAPALRRHLLQPCRRRAGQPFGFRCSQAGLWSTAGRLQCGDVQPPDWEIGSGWRVQVSQCSSSGHACHCRTVGPGRLTRIMLMIRVGLWGIKTFPTKKKKENLHVVSPGRWCQTSGAGPAPPPAPAMLSPCRAAILISR